MAFFAVDPKILEYIQKRGVYQVMQIEEIISGVGLDIADKIILIPKTDYYSVTNVPTLDDMLIYTAGTIVKDKIYCTEIHDDGLFHYTMPCHDLPHNIFVTNRHELMCLKYICVLLHNAVKAGNLREVYEILGVLNEAQTKLVLNMHVGNSSNGTALHMAVRHHHPITCYCSVVNCGEFHTTAYRREITMLLIASGADINKTNGFQLDVQKFAHVSKPKITHSNPAPEVFELLPSADCAIN